MDKPTIIYVVGSGEYSDFGIDAVFSTEELAKEFAAKIEETGERASIETLTLDAKKDVTVRTEWHAGAGNLYRLGSPHYGIESFDASRPWIKHLRLFAGFCHFVFATSPMMRILQSWLRESRPTRPR